MQKQCLDAIYSLSRIIEELQRELHWKQIQLEAREEEIKKLKEKINS